MNKIVLIFAIALFFSCQSASNGQNNETETSVETAAWVEKTISISGMHCDMCVASIEKGVGEVEGVQSVVASLSDSTAVVKFDAGEANVNDIQQAIEKRGYSIKEVPDN